MHCFLEYIFTYTLGQSCHWGSDHKFPCTGSQLELAPPKLLSLYILSLTLYGLVIKALAHNPEVIFYSSAAGESNSKLWLSRNLISTLGCGLKMKKGCEEKGFVKPSCWLLKCLHFAWHTYSFPDQEKKDSMQRGTTSRGDWVSPTLRIVHRPVVMALSKEVWDASLQPLRQRKELNLGHPHPEWVY